ncbi:MAG: ATP-dependent sacrificial sulfur transferase LarE [Kiritimatiellae bacterium]|nr:ATP-dependent sacrificial sulfur transferase LarE [Kiritimatiellia bacterium]
MAALTERVRDMGSALIAFSGGVDSSFLACVARQVLGDKAVALTATGPAFPKREIEGAREFATKLGIRHQFVDVGHLQKDIFAHNPPDRCYQCKRALFTTFKDAARGLDLAHVADGTNTDDAGQHRPGLKALAELGIRSPLREAGFGKRDIREASRRLGLSTADQPTVACLATRFPYNTAVADDTLRAVDRAEEALHDLGFAQVRVRVHGDLARIELDPAEIPQAMSEDLRAKIVAALRACGFSRIVLDLEGYRTGSMDTG